MKSGSISLSLSSFSFSVSKKKRIKTVDRPAFSRMQIEMLIQTFNPTMVFVEHNHTFKKNIATKTIKKG